MSGYSAITPGTDLAQYARELVRMHDAVIGGSRSARHPRPVVFRSWSRVLGLGLVPDRSSGRDPVGGSELERLRARSPLHLVVDELEQVITSVADASHFLMVVANADGIILWRKGASGVRRRADLLGFAEGAEWTEQRVGTNAIGTALAEAAPVQLFSGEHFEQAQHPWYCTAYPIHDPRNGDLLGIVDISGPALSLHPAIGALVQTAVLLGESRLWRHHEQRLAALRTATAPLVAATGEPLLIVDRDGWVAHSAGVATRDRIAAPEPGRALAVPGLGLCLAEPVADGWMVRPSSTQRAIRARLRLGDSPVLEVESDVRPWRIGLSARHGQILALLQRAGRAGMTPRQLSAALFGDGEHLVTVRAEVSRLRRTLGAVIASRPYRIADGVTLTVDEPGTRAARDDPGAVVRS